MSPSEQEGERVPPEVTAIAVALAALWAQQAPVADVATPAPGSWRLSGRRWERTGTYRWS